MFVQRRVIDNRDCVINNLPYDHVIRIKAPMLVETSKLYTATIFEAFQGQYERSMAAYTIVLEEYNTCRCKLGVGMVV
jgi:hypothetical protein